MLHALLAVFVQAAPGEGFSAAPFVYALHQRGKLSVNGEAFDDLPSDFDPNGPPLFPFPVFEPPHTEEAFASLSVFGSDRFALRRDGRVFRDGHLLWKLPKANDPPYWRSLSASVSGVFALRGNGRLATNGAAIALLPRDGFDFVRVVGHGGHAYSLRTDGAVFEDGSATPLFQFAAGPACPGGPSDGNSTNTEWTSLAVDPVGGDLFALRRDGSLFSGDLPAGPVAGSAVASLPFSCNGGAADRFVDLEFTTDGVASQWIALRADGAIFTAADPVFPLVDLPGDGSDADETFVDLATFADEFWSVRWDGRLFRNADGVSVLNLPSDRYVGLALGAAPDPPGARNPRPSVALYRAVAVEGSAISIPILATDLVERTENLVVSPLFLPAGATWNDAARTIDWASPGPVGAHEYTIVVDDGVNIPRSFRGRIRVVAPDNALGTNARPAFSRIRGARAVVFPTAPPQPLALPILAVDADGDPIALALDPSTPLPSGASFDPGTGVFSWTADASQVGGWTIRFTASAAGAVAGLTVRIRVSEAISAL